MNTENITLQSLLQGPAIDAADRATHGALPETQGFLALPDNFQTHDLEKLLPHRRRARGTMTTRMTEAFAAYVATYKQPGTCIFVAPEAMTATAALNLGTVDLPGHCDDAATLAPKATAAYTALLTVATGRPVTQQALAEFLEDWAELVTCSHGDEPMETKRAVAAVRKVTIESLSRSENTQEQLSASRSAFEQVKATSGDGVLPTRISFTTQPYVGFTARTFVARVAVLTEGKTPNLTLRIIKAEEHAEQMAVELEGLVRQALGGVVPVVIGSYSPKA